MSKLRVLVQAGHVAPRQPGHESQTGTNGEIELVSKIQHVLVGLLQADGRFEALPVPGWIRPDNIRVDAALFLHADGSGDSHSSGYSFGYPNYAVNQRLAGLIATEFSKIPGHPPHHSDNYTKDLEGYYGFHHVVSNGPEVVVEHGFLTNPHERVWLNANVKQLAMAEYKALLAYFKLAPPGPPPAPPKPKKKFSYTVKEPDEPTPALGKTNFPGKTGARVMFRANKLKKGERIVLTIERL
jgi:hypothetical protein